MQPVNIIICLVNLSARSDILQLNLPSGRRFPKTTAEPNRQPVLLTKRCAGTSKMASSLVPKSILQASISAFPTGAIPVSALHSFSLRLLSGPTYCPTPDGFQQSPSNGRLAPNKSFLLEVFSLSRAILSGLPSMRGTISSKLTRHWLIFAKC